MIGENHMSGRGWAIVTGASGGMGTAFTKSLAQRGYSVLAVARGVERLARMAEELKKDGAFVETLAVDLASAEGLKAVVDRAHALGDIELLVNNAGLSTSGDFLDQSADKEIQSIRVNVEALYTLTRKIVPGMVARKRGGILNIASIVAFQAIPYWTTYAATKAFVLAFGEGLAYELRDSGVRVVTVCPGFTQDRPLCRIRCPWCGWKAFGPRNARRGRARCPRCVRRRTRGSRRWPDEPPPSSLGRPDPAFHPTLAHGEDVCANHRRRGLEWAAGWRPRP